MSECLGKKCVSSVDGGRGCIHLTLFLVGCFKVHNFYL